MEVRELVQQTKQQYPGLITSKGRDFTDAEYLACLVFKLSEKTGAGIKEITTEAITSTAARSKDIKQFLTILGFKLE